MKTILSSTQAKLGSVTRVDPEIIALLDDIQEKELVLLNLCERLDERLKILQSECTHGQTIKKFESDVPYNKRKLIEKKCSDCGFQFTKPKGSSHITCERCWGPMEENGSVQGEGFRRYFYKCTKCGHEESNT